ALAALATAAALADGNHKGNGNGNGTGGNDEDNGTTFATKLVGYEETPVTLNSPGSGSFTAAVNAAGTAIDYTLSYTTLSSAITQSHIHFGRPATTGQIVLFLCTNIGLPAGVTVPMPQACPPGPATITGTLTAADVIARPTQNIDAGAAGFAEMIKAMHARAAYANVHTTLFTTGEIRGAIEPRDDGNDDD
ncbi:MAG TPA: CHRD domain-containing protein, partial [Casimicrobiaceae bacterium]|nr:CHRD domain-containing protein [Casimicrobiaceae bacterium]